MAMRETAWVPKVLLALAAVISVAVLLKGLKKTDATYDAVETRGIELQRLPSAREQRAAVTPVDQVSSLDLTPKVALREADPQEPPPPEPPPPPARTVAQAPPAPPPPPPEPEQRAFVKPALRPRGLPKERTTNASSGAFLPASKNAPSAPASAPAAPPPAEQTPDGPRVFRDTTGKASYRD